MPLYYRDALKRGQKEFRACTASGEYPYLPVLDDFLPQEAMIHTTDLGVVQIPLEMVCGTRTSGRTQAFARNFMPLMDEDSEFALKWNTLCQSQIEEGIREPIYAYEFMFRYYVQEGNKRVSVLKYLEADAVNAHVIRILPQRNGSREVDVYYEFLDFYQLSQINFLEITKPGGYARLQNLVGKKDGEPWSEEERKRFSNAYYYFLQAYKANGGKRLHLAAGDAMLAYLEIYGYPSLLGKGADEIKNMVAKVWEEITLQQEAAPIAVQLAPEEEKGEKGGGLLAKVLPKAAPKVIKVAFLHDRDPGSSGWTYSHELGRTYLEHAFTGRVETCAYFNALDSDPLPILEEAIAQGNQVIFTTSPRLLPSSLRAAVDHPDVMILNCSLNTSHRYVRTVRFIKDHGLISLALFALMLGGTAYLFKVVPGALVPNEDQGYFLGEHGFFDKRMFYEEAARMPFVIRYPAEIPAGQRLGDLVLNVDFAATLADYAGVRPPDGSQGRSFRDNLRGETPEDWRTSIYYRYWTQHKERPAHIESGQTATS